MNQEIIERLKNVRIYVIGKSESKEIQEIAFSMGIYWGSGEKNYIDCEWGSLVNNIVFGMRGGRLSMLRGARTDEGRITIDELRDFAESIKMKESSVPMVAKEPPVWTPKVGDKVRCVKTDGFPGDLENFLLSVGIILGGEYTVHSVIDTYSGYQRGLTLAGYQCTHPITSFEPVNEIKPEWTPKEGDIVRCTSESGYRADLPSNFMKDAGIKIGQEYVVSGYIQRYALAPEESGISLRGFSYIHPITSFEPVKEKMITLDPEASCPGVADPGDLENSLDDAHFMDYWEDRFPKSLKIPADRFGASEHPITTSSWEGIGCISRSVGVEAILRVQKNRRGASPDNVVVPAVQKASKVNLVRIEVEDLPYINVPYRGKTTKRIPEVKITKPEVHAYHTI